MKIRILVLLAVVIALVSFQVRSAQASVAPITTVNAFFAALDTGDHAAAIAAFTPDAMATLVRGETYQGPEGIAQLVQLMEQPGRYHDIVHAHMVGNTVTVVVDVYDRGVRWGEDTLVFEVQGNKLHRLDEQAFKLRLP